jgi:hypothetical protein
MDVWHAEALDGFALEVELDQHGGPFADDPTVVSGFDCNNLWRFEFQQASVAVFELELSADEESHVRMHAQLGPDDRLHVLRPPESSREHHPFDPTGPGACDLERDAADDAPFRSLDRSHEHSVATLHNAGRLPGCR